MFATCPSSSLLSLWPEKVLLALKSQTCGMNGLSRSLGELCLPAAMAAVTRWPPLSLLLG